MTSSQPPSASNVTCGNCGYDLTGATIGSTCPECGAAVAPSFQSYGQRTSGFAITSMVLGIVSIPVCFCYGVPAVICGGLGIMFWYLARQQIERNEVGGSSAGMATAGLICGIIGTSLGAIYIVLLILAVVFNIAMAP